MQKSLAVALLLGAVSSTNLSAQSSIWDESTEALYDVCGQPDKRWADNSNSFNTFKSAYGANSKYSDTDFQGMEMLYAPKAPPQGNRASEYENGVKGFKRPSEFYPGEEISTKGSLGEFAPAGIKQGGFSDCWFLAGATAIAENPVRMHQIVHKNSRDYTSNGIFRYFFWVGDSWVPINIDDRLPARYTYSNSKDYFSPYGADRSNFGAMWMPLLEKAYAKLNGNYDRTEWGSGYESLRQLSARPVFFFQHEKIKASEGDEFALFHRMSKENHPMVISCCNVPGGSAAPDGLQNAHAYTLLDVVEYKGTRLAKIRNPWSTEGYNGEWSDKDTKNWTPANLKALNHKLANDGVFFMPFHKFLNKPFFRSTTVVMYNDFTTQKSYSVAQKVQQMAITIQVPSKQVVYFTLESFNTRFEKNCAKKAEQVFVNAYFFKGTRFPGIDGLLFPLGYMGSSMYHVTVGRPDFELDAGTYTLMVANWACEGSCAQLDYKVIAYQRGSGTVSVKY